MLLLETLHRLFNLVSDVINNHLIIEYFNNQLVTCAVQHVPRHQAA